MAERLSWENDPVSIVDRDQNEEALWAVNAELDIYEPAVEDEQILVGGRRSRQNYWFPFDTEHEANATMNIIAKAENLNAQSWRIWRHCLGALSPESKASVCEVASKAPPPPNRRPPLPISAPMPVGFHLRSSRPRSRARTGRSSNQWT